MRDAHTCSFQGPSEDLPPRASFPVHDENQSYLQFSMLSKTSSGRCDVRHKRLGELSSRLLKLCQPPGQWYSGIPVLPLRREGPETLLSAGILSLEGGGQWACRKDYFHFKS